MSSLLEVKTSPSFLNSAPYAVDRKAISFSILVTTLA
nr:MAG TPA: hypothetical protein [Caudoviricetes sp.]